MTNQEKTFYDPVHGYMDVSALALQFIDTPEFQRLRNIKQLGASYYVFPGACHNRFEHSLGVYHLTREFTTHLQGITLSERDIELISLAGLLHDIGHGPFSHVFDFYLETIAEEQGGIQHDPSYHHEYRSTCIVRDLVKRYRILLEPEETDLICYYIYPENTPPKLEVTRKITVLSQVVSNPINHVDVDKFDYILRDNHYLGTSTHFQLNRLIKKARVINDQICFIDKDVSTLYNMFQARYNMHRFVYNHPVTKAIEFMLLDIMRHLDLKEHLRIPAFYELTDYTVLYQHKTELLKRLERRRIYRYIFEFDHCPERTYFDSNFFKQAKELGVNLEKNDLRIHFMKIGFMKNDINPIDQVRFYSSRNLDQSFWIPRSKVSHLLPTVFCEHKVRVFYTGEDRSKEEKIHRVIKVIYHLDDH